MTPKKNGRRGKPLPNHEQKVNRNVLSKEVADQLRARIREQRLAPESRLGTEAELAEEFGVSRTVIREAVGQLRGLGLVTSRQGRGLCVASVDMIDTLSKTLVPMLGDQANWPELCHLRFVLEIGSLPLAVERATEDQIKRMHHLADEMLKMVQKPDRGTKAVERFVAQREVDFHQLIFNAAGSPLAGRFHSILVEYFFESYGPGMHGTPPTLKDMEDHVKLAIAMKDRDLNRAYLILIDHIRHILS